MAMQFSRILRCFANKFSLSAKASYGENFHQRISMGARSYSSAPVSQILGLPPASTLLTAFRSAVNVSGYVSFAWTSYWFGCPKFRIKYADWIAEKKVHAMLEKLESEKHESAEAYLAVLDREVNALKEELSNRSADVSKTSLLKREADLLQLDLYKREVAALKEKVLSWVDKEEMYLGRAGLG